MQSLFDRLEAGLVIPAHPLALTKDNQLDEETQRNITRHYLASGAGGVAVGVHTTQFEIRSPEHQLFKPVLSCVIDEVKKHSQEILCIAGICGGTKQAVEEAKTAKELGYDLGLLSFGGLDDWTEEELIEHAKEVGKQIPLFGFYLQPAVGGRDLSYDFWAAFANIPAVTAIKVAPFNRYKTLDVVRAVCHSKRRDSISLYTGNDDHIISDLLESYTVDVNGTKVTKQFAGGLLGQWAVGTKAAVDFLKAIHSHRASGTIPRELLTLNTRLTDVNAALFDAKNQFKGSIAGIHYVLAKQGIMKHTHCLSDHEVLSSGQAEAIDRVMAEHADLF